MNNDDLVLANTVIDLEGAGAQGTLTLNSYDPDTITITGLGYSTMIDSVTIPQSSYSLGVGSASTQWATGTNGYSFTNTIAPTAVNISNTGIDMAAGADLKIDGKSLKEFMSKMEQRLAILVPDPAKLEKFQALKRAYEHYKTMESLCFDESEESK